MERLLRRKDRQGLTYDQLSKDSGVPVSTLRWWKRRLAEEASLTSAEREPGVRFVEATLAPVSPSEARYEIVLESGRRLVLDEGFEAGAVRTLIGLLEASC